MTSSHAGRDGCRDSATWLLLVLVIVVRVIRSVDFFRAIFVGFVRVSFRFFGSMVSSFRAEDNPEKSDCRGGTPEILQEM